MIDFCSAEKAIVKGAIYKSNSDKIALREITVIENTTFKFL
jgi:hypothetical protein